MDNMIIPPINIFPLSHVDEIIDNTEELDEIEENDEKETIKEDHEIDLKG